MKYNIFIRVCSDRARVESNMEKSLLLIKMLIIDDPFSKWPVSLQDH